MNEPVKRLRDYLIAGGVLYVIGVAAMVLAWPHTEAGAYSAESSGSMIFTLLGGLATTVGGAIILVALIGLGVKFGREAVDLD